MKTTFGSEPKYTWSSASLTNLAGAATAVITILQPTVQGENVDQRSGSSVVMQRLVINLILENFISPVVGVTTLGTNYNVMGRLLVIRVNDTFQAQTPAGGFVIPTIYDIFAVNNGNNALCHTWYRRLDRNLKGWFTVIKSVKFRMNPCPPASGVLGTTLATQRIQTFKRYSLSCPMKFKLEFPENEQNINTAAPYGGSLTYSNSVPLNGRFYLMIHTDEGINFAYNYRHFFNDLQ
nr:MAG TPA: capsid protein [Genomoviridae sp.]